MNSAATRRRCPRRHVRPGRRGLFDIVRCEYAAPAFVIAPGDGAAWDRARANREMRRRRPNALRTAVLQAEVAPVACFRPVFSCYGRQSAPDPNSAGRTRFLLSSRGLRGKITGVRLYPEACFSPVIYRQIQANRHGSARSSACACIRALPNRTSRRRINVPGSRIPRSAARHWFAVPSGSGQIVPEYRKWVAARFRLSAFDETPARCRCE